MMKTLEAKTMLSDGIYNAMIEVIEAKGLTQAGYIRQLILEDIVKSQEYVSQIQSITDRTETEPKQSKNSTVIGVRMRGDSA